MNAWRIGLGIAGGLVAAWLVLVAALLVAKPRGGALREAMRLLPDLLRLVGRLAADRSLPAGVRGRLALLAAYLAMPFDLVPDFVPVLGYADDAIVVAWTLRSVTRQAGLEAVRRHWPGTDDGFAALSRLCGLDRPPPARRSWWFEAALVGGFAALTLALAAGLFLDTDIAIYEWCEAHRPTAAYWVTRGLNFIGQGGPLTGLAALIAVWLGWRRHSVRPLLPVVAAFLLTTATIGPIKVLTQRGAPHNQDLVAHPERLFSDPHATEYPSGHVVNAVVWYGVLVLLLAAYLPAGWRTALRVAPPVLACFTNTYLGYHWLTDAVAALFLGLALDSLLYRVPWNDLPLGRPLTAAGWAGPALHPPRDLGR